MKCAMKKVRKIHKEYATNVGQGVVSYTKKFQMKCAMKKVRKIHKEYATNVGRDAVTTLRD